MVASRSEDIVLVADIGGTNARFACFDLGSQQILSRHSVRVLEYSGISSALDSARQFLPEFSAISAACIAIAGPVKDDWVKASNSAWAFSQQDLRAHYGWPRLLVINDFVAAGYGTLLLSSRDYRAVDSGIPPERPDSPIAVIGPGTGLGVAALLPSGDATWTSLATEGGHARLAPGNDQELELLAVLHRQLGAVQREDVLSGRGLCNLYRAWMTLHGKEYETQGDPAAITAAALADETSEAAEVLRCFCGILGVVTADVVLGFAAWGGVYLVGGILPRISELLISSPFRERFETHPQFENLLKPIPTALVTQENLGLLGAAYYLQTLIAEKRATGK